MWRKKINIFSFILTLVTIFSCQDYLDVVPDDTPTVKIVFENRSSAEKYLATTYRYLPGIGPATDPSLLGGDELWINPIATANGRAPHSFDIAKGLMSISNTPHDLYNNYYVGIRECNTFLEHIHLPYDMYQSEKDKWAAEVKVLKALYHFELMRRFGPIIINDKNLPVSSSPAETQKTRSSVENVVSYCVKLIDEAMPFLSSSIKDGTIEARRINVTVASALKAKILVTSASPLFNGNKYWANMKDKDGNELISSTLDPNKWETAKIACLEAIKIAHEEGHELYEWKNDSQNGIEFSDYTKRKFSIIGSVTENESNDERLWEAGDFNNQNSYMAKMNDPLSKVTQFALTSVHQLFSPPLRIVEMFYTKNGLPIDEDREYNYLKRYEVVTSGQGSNENIKFGHQTINLHFEREPRFYASIGFDGAKYIGYGRFDLNRTWISELRAGRVSGYKGDPKQFEYSATGYLAKKLVSLRSMHIEGSSGFHQTTYPWSYIRLADLYLLCAEALNESDGPGEKVYEYIDKVRERAGLIGIKEAWKTYAHNAWKIEDKNELRKLIHQERLIELVFEGHRFWDLKRWKRSVEMMNNKAIIGWNIEGADAETFYSKKMISEQSFNERDYFWPIPLGVLLNNPNIKQNPGW